MLEKTIETKLKKTIEGLGHGVICAKLESPGMTGMPDRLVLLPGGRVIFVELKAPGKHEKARQVYIQDKLRELGFEVFSTVRTPEQVEAIRARCAELIDHAEI